MIVMIMATVLLDGKFMGNIQAAKECASDPKATGEEITAMFHAMGDEIANTYKTEFNPDGIGE